MHDLLKNIFWLLYYKGVFVMGRENVIEREMIKRGKGLKVVVICCLIQQCKRIDKEGVFS